MNIISTEPKLYGAEEAYGIARELNRVDEDGWKYSVEYRNNGMSSGSIVVVYDENGDWVGYWNDGGIAVT